PCPPAFRAAGRTSPSSGSRTPGRASPAPPADRPSRSRPAGCPALPESSSAGPTSLSSPLPSWDCCREKEVGSLQTTILRRIGPFACFRGGWFVGEGLFGSAGRDSSGG